MSTSIMETAGQDLDFDSTAVKGKKRKHSLVKKLNGLAKKLNLRKKRASCPEEDLEFITAQTGLTRGCVEKEYRQFLKSNPSGVMEPSCLKALVQESLPGVDTSGLSDHIWRIYDTNLDHVVDFKEFVLADWTSRHGSAEENLRQIFRLFDINSDGKVEREELDKVATELSKVGELKEEVVKAAFEEMDADRDGGVTQEEFIQACLQHRIAATSLALRVIYILHG